MLANQVLFTTSSRHEPCTQGVDLAVLPLDGVIDQSRSYSTDLHVGFADVEGQGDRGVVCKFSLLLLHLASSAAIDFNFALYRRLNAASSCTSRLQGYPI